MSKSRAPVVSKGWRDFAVPATALVVTVAYLVLCEIAVLELLLVLGYAGLLTTLGAGALKPLARHFSDRLSFSLAAWAFSLLILFALNFVLFHRPIQLHLGIATLPKSFMLANGIWLVIAIALWRRNASTRIGLPWIAPARGVVLGLFLAAAVMASLTYAGRLNPTYFPKTNWDLPEWAEQGDFKVHVLWHTKSMLKSRFPPHKLAHRGVQLAVINDAAMTGLHGAISKNAIKRARAYALPFYFMIIYLSHLVASRHFGLSNRISALAVACALFFGTISLAPFSAGYSSYSLGTSAAGAFYHSVTQLWSYPFALMGVLLVLRSLNEKLDSAFVLGAFFIAGSFFFKPSAFSILAPPLVLMCLLARSGERRFAFYAALILFAVPIFWIVYSAVFETTRPDPSLTFAPFQKYMRSSHRQLPPIVTSHLLFWQLTILVTSVGAFLPALVTVERRWIALRPATLLAWMRDQRGRIFMLTPLLIGLASAILFTSSKRVGLSNLGWGVATGILLAVPQLLQTVTFRRSVWVRGLTLALIILHLWGGAQHLVSFLPEGRLTGKDWQRTEAESELTLMRQIP